MNILNFRRKNKVKHLKWYDVLIITIIMFGYFIWNSLSSFLYLQDNNIAQIPEFTDTANWYSLIFQLILLLLSFLYLYLINFDFPKWKIQVNLKSVIKGVLLFLGVALLFDLYFTIVYTIIPYSNVDNSIFYE